jgi:hypothetical protein
MIKIKEGVAGKTKEREAKERDVLFLL